MKRQYYRNNPNRSVTNGTLVMVNTEGSRDALFEIENIDGFQFPSDYPMWDVGSGTLSSSNSTSATASFTESEGVWYIPKLFCTNLNGCVALVDENMISIDVAISDINNKIKNISDKVEDCLNECTSGVNCIIELTGSGAVKNVDKYGGNHPANPVFFQH